ncbi:hypothetical protein FKM82_027558 [Ascaphus truei]
MTGPGKERERDGGWRESEGSIRWWGRVQLVGPVAQKYLLLPLIKANKCHVFTLVAYFIFKSNTLANQDHQTSEISVCTE